MISMIQGKIADRSFDTLVIMTDAGIGFELSVPASLAAGAGSTGSSIRLYTYLHVREDAVLLFGFESQEQKALFLKLIAISGVGPKAAMAILSTMTTQEFLGAVATNDVKSITRAPGVGKKIAERIILEMRSQLDTFIEASQQVAAVAVASPADAAQADAVQALISLGYTGAEALTAISKIQEPGLKTEELILRALRQLDQ